MILIQADYETAERIGASGTFQVISITVDGVVSPSKSPSEEIIDYFFGGAFIFLCMKLEN